MSDTVRDGLARAIRDAYANDIIPADTLLSDEGWSGLVGSVEEWHPEADAALAYIATHPVVGVDAMCAVLRAHQPRSLIDTDGLIRQGCTCGLITERRVGAHTFHQAEQIAALRSDVPAGPVVQAWPQEDEYTPPLNPDCAAGNKHRACAGDAWEEMTDSPTTCACECHAEVSR